MHRPTSHGVHQRLALLATVQATLLLVVLVLLPVAVSAQDEVARTGVEPSAAQVEPDQSPGTLPQSDTDETQSDETDSLLFWALFTVAGIVLIVSGVLVLRRTRSQHSS